MVEWDHFSLIFNDERIYIFGGEMHTFRLPVPELWLDIMQKVKAMGMRSLSVYFHWGYHMPTPSDVDMETGARNLVRLFEMARDMGIFLTVRPGPYINAETNAGGFPLVNQPITTILFPFCYLHRS
jgi:beta-galactosidase GanA